MTWQNNNFACVENTDIIIHGSCELSADGRKVTAKVHQVGEGKTDYILQRVGDPANLTFCDVSSGECVIILSHIDLYQFTLVKVIIVITLMLWHVFSYKSVKTINII